MLILGLPAGAANEPDEPPGIDALDYLPPALEWDGKSRALKLAPDHEWATPAERDDLATTPRYDETVRWLARLAAASPQVEMLEIGRSAEGRTIWMVLASAAPAGERTPEALRASGKPIVLVQAGIHSGEIDGKDAGMMLLRDMTVLGKRPDLLAGAHFLFVPILSVDGHERFSRYNRINQRGPVEMGWRTNARNLNLNRDYTKLETAGVRAMVATIDRWQPDLYIDVHVTDGADYQYDVTWGMTPEYGWSPAISGWVERTLRPAVDRRLEEMGHVPGPFIWAVNGRDLDGGVAVWMGSPRFSNVYGDARHLPTILVENHSLKPYEQRVLGTYVFLEAVLSFVAEQRDSLRAAVAADRARRPEQVVLSWQQQPSKTESRPVKAVAVEIVDSPVSGDGVARWRGVPEEREATFVTLGTPDAVVVRPAAYYIPAAWSPIAEKLRLHGIRLERLDRATRVDVEMYRLPDAAIAGGGSAFDHRSFAYEGRVRVDPGTPVPERRTLELPAGSYRASTDQPLGDLLVLLLEPASPDSFFQWGYFLEILTRTEYAEAYVMEPMARAMLDSDPALRSEFERLLADDPEFAASPQARLDWFYRKTPYFDPRYRLYPIARE
jgi:hypothetical protein